MSTAKIVLISFGVFVATLFLLGALVPGRELQFRSSVDLELPLVESWVLLQDLSLAHHYVPGIERVDITTDQTTGVGASRRVYSSADSYIVETVTQWQEGQGFTLQLLSPDGGPAVPFARAYFDYALSKAEIGTRAELTLRCVLRGGIVGEWLARLLLRDVFQQQIDDVALGFKAFYESTPRQ